MSLTLTNTTRSKPNIPFTEIKNSILGKGYDLSLNIIGKKRARQINIASRKKTYTPNVLSFPLTKSAGEIYLTPMVAKKEAKNFGHSKMQHLTFLYIHGLLHLKGYGHGKKMESLEEKYLKKYG